MTETIKSPAAHRAKQPAAVFRQTSADVEVLMQTDESPPAGSYKECRFAMHAAHRFYSVHLNEFLYIKISCMESSVKSGGFDPK